MLMLQLTVLGVGLIISFGNALNTCDRNYLKVGCYDEYRPLLKDLLVYERYEIQWKNMENYLHHLACTCEESVREANKKLNASERYVGFALHYWAECYGKTQKQLDSMARKKPSERCTGNKYYTGCITSNRECTGHAFSEFVFKLKTEAGQTEEITACDEEEVELSCSKGSYVFVTKASYKARTQEKCGAPVTGDWRSECSLISNKMFSKVIAACTGKQSCKLKKWKENHKSSCGDVPRYLAVIYTCKTAAAAGP